MRALESHSVDVTFFYVPQIVQTLRYDLLGYVERYIVETAKFSGLFAHQIIWNIKANAYKDEDSQIVSFPYNHFQRHVVNENLARSCQANPRQGHGLTHLQLLRRRP